MLALFLDDNDDGDGKENGKKQYVYINKRQLCTCITLCTFCTYVRLETYQFHEPGLWIMSTQHNKCHFLLLNLDNDRYGPKENFAKICQIK